MLTVLSWLSETHQPCVAINMISGIFNQTWSITSGNYPAHRRSSVKVNPVIISNLRDSATLNMRISNGTCGYIRKVWAMKLIATYRSTWYASPALWNSVLVRDRQKSRVLLKTEVEKSILPNPTIRVPKLVRWSTVGVPCISFVVKT